MKYSIFDLQFDEYVRDFVDFKSKEGLKKSFTRYLINRMDENELEKITEHTFEVLIDFLEYRIVMCDEKGKCKIIED